MKIDQAQKAQNPDATPDLRYEIKLVCSPHLLAQARSWIRLHPAGFVVAYPPRCVNSLYLDTPHLSSLNDNLGGVSYRRKLRLRWYDARPIGRPFYPCGARLVSRPSHPCGARPASRPLYEDGDTDIHPILELKQKRNLLGTKKRYVLPCRLDLTLPWTEILNKVQANVGVDWQAILQTVNQPTLINRYQREYYVTPDGTIRATLDFGQVAYDQRLSRRPNLRLRLPLSDAVVIEIKSAPEQVERLQEVAARFPVSRTRHSKYVRGLSAGLG